MAQYPATPGAVVDGGADFHPLEPPWCLGVSAEAGATALGDQAGDGVPRWHHDPGPPESRWCGKKGGSSEQRDKREALGRSRGGFSTKASVIADGSGRAIGFTLAPGQANELPMAPVLLSFLTAVALWIVADRGYSSHALRMLIWSLGSRPAIPTKRNEAPVACPPWIYPNRNLVERCWSRLKEWRAVATRYEKTERSFMGVLCMAATMDWLKA
jgi:transposase